MRACAPARRLAAAAVLSLAFTATAVAGTADKKITPKGVGKVKLGALATDLRADGLIGRLKPGCELGGAGHALGAAEGAAQGHASTSREARARSRAINDPRRGGGARRRVGDTLADITAAFPKRKIIRRPSRSSASRA